MKTQTFAGTIVFTNGTETNQGDEIEADLVTPDLAQYFADPTPLVTAEEIAASAGKFEPIEEPKKTKKGA